MSEEYDSVDNIANEIRSKLDSITSKKTVLVVYAFNSTGKTRITNTISKIDSENEGQDIFGKALYYSAFLEDIFKWDNENYILTFNPNSWIIKLVNEQGIEKEVVNNFKDIARSKIEPLFDFIKGEVVFNIASGDDNSHANIKISKGEESIFIWSIFYSVLEVAIDAINTDVDNRTTSLFNNLKYIVIDDPVSSVDDTKIITIAIKLIELIKLSKGNAVKYLVTTHHALFYNVLVNSLKRDNGCNFKSYNIFKEGNMLKLLEQGDSPFAYHLYIKEIMENAVKNDSIEKYHFNLFRNLLEKTSSFLGYNDWSDCILGDNKKEFIRILNLYSHSKLVDLENRELSNEDKTLFQEMFTTFLADFRWK